MIRIPDTISAENDQNIARPPSDIFSLIVSLEPLLDNYQKITKTHRDETGKVKLSIKSDSFTSVSYIKLRMHVSETVKPTKVTMAIDGAVKGTVVWTLQPNNGNTLVSVKVDYELISQQLKDDIIGAVNEVDRNDSKFDSRSLIIAETTSLLEELLFLKELSEQDPPPACITSPRISDFSFPLSNKVSSHLEKVTSHTERWTKQMGFAQTETMPSWVSEVPRVTCRIHLNAPLEELSLCNDWYTWGFIYDDQLDNTSLGEQPEVIEEFQQPLLEVFGLDNSRDQKVPLVRGLSDIWQRAVDVTIPAWQDRFVQHHVDFFSAQQWEAYHRSQVLVPEKDTYIRTSRDAAATAIPFALGEIASDTQLTDSDYWSEAAVALREVAANILVWTNDVYSLPKELPHKEVHNLVIVVRKEHGCSLQDAMEKVCQMIQTEIDQFLDYAETVSTSSEVSSELSTYATMLKQVVSGHLLWCQETNRYPTDNIPDDHK